MDTNISLVQLLDVIYECQYITNCNSNKNRDVNSFSYLINDVVLSQSDCIKLGYGFEKLLADIIIKFTKLKNIKDKNIKDSREKDHLFIDDVNKIIYYAELKSNINLDTEKSKSTYTKCLFIVNELEKKYENYTIKWCLLSYRYLSKFEITKVIINKYKPIYDNIYGINEYFMMLNIPFTFTEETYKLYVNNVAKEMFSNS